MMARSRAVVLRGLFRDELARGSSVNFGFTAITLFLQFLAGVTLLAYLGPAGVGAFSIGMILLDFSMILVHLPGVAFVRDFASAEREEALSTVAGLKLLLCIPACAAIVVLAFPVSEAVGVPASMILVLAIYPPFSAIASIATMVFEARRKMARRNITSLVETSGRLAAVLLVLAGVVAFDPRPFGASVLWVAGIAPAALASVLLAGVPRPRLAHRHKAREYFAFGWRTTVAQVFQKQLLWVGTASIYLAFLSTSLDTAQTQAGLYRTAYSLMFYMVLIGTAVPAMLYPMLARAFADPDPEAGRAEVHRLLSLSLYYELILILPVAGGLVVVGPLMFAALVPAFVPAGLLTQLLAGSGVLFCLTLPAAVALPAANRPDLVLRLFLVQLAVALTLNVLLVPQVGAPWGGAIGAVIADWASGIVGFAYGFRLLSTAGIPLPSIARARASIRERPEAPAP